MNYNSAGVDISKGDRLVARIKAMMGASGAQIGHFGGAVSFPVEKYREPLLVSSIDSVGTKTAVAKVLCQVLTPDTTHYHSTPDTTHYHSGIGRDMVHHSINDIACCGADPLYFLDYFAMGIMDVDLASEVIGGVIEACKRWEFPLVGGENAEMPGVYRDDEYDLVGSITGIVEQSEYIDGSGIIAGDILVGFPSAGLHTNGYSLARKVVESSDFDYTTDIPELGTKIGDALLAEHRCYLSEIRELKRNFKVKGVAHITGGGLPGNVSRIIPKGLKAEIDYGNWDEPPIFDLLRKTGNIAEEDMRTTFNIGVGLVAVLDSEYTQAIVTDFPDDLYSPFLVGKIRFAG
ncbi:MAG: phosphoribosylformylglycinamidine cyclo-ligase [Candidatus Hatepunaea meridiana]|nr:phosphoribosylformylglycinamidine cyclo-ligase [Candidatus Hatepunaea meridiana]